jgi:hypothetical protein
VRSRITVLTHLVVMAFIAGPAAAQLLDNGSTGADGPFEAVRNAATGQFGALPAGTQTSCAVTPPLQELLCTVTVPLREPPNHIFNFTTITVGDGVTVQFTRNRANTPALMLASGDVVVRGTIDVSGEPTNGTTPGKGGPGGFGGGTRGSAGDGPGGSASFVAPPCFATCYGTPELQPLIGGSGGFGPDAGGGGGGALLIGSSGVIDVTGNILSSGGFSACGGSGGGIRLVGLALRGNGNIRAKGGCGTSDGDGRIRFETIEAFQFTGTADPGPTGFVGLPILFPPVVPSLRIVSIAGVAVPANAGRNLFSPDVSAPAIFGTRVSVIVEATNVPKDTPAKVIVNPQMPTATRTETPFILADGPMPCVTDPAQLCVRGEALVIAAPGLGFISAIIASVVPVK